MTHRLPKKSKSRLVTILQWSPNRINAVYGRQHYGVAQYINTIGLLVVAYD